MMYTCKQLLCCCLFLWTAVYAHAQQKPLVAEAEYYRFINAINADNEKDFILNETASFGGFNENLKNAFNDTVFTAADVAFMKQQLRRANHYKWKKDRITHARIVPSKTIHRLFKQKSGDGWGNFYNAFPNSSGYQIISVPLFSCNGQLCLFYRDYHCGGLCGGGSLAIYQKRGDTWQILSWLVSWIS